MSNRPEEPPFARHKRYYLFLKVSVLILAGLMVLHFFFAWKVIPETKGKSLEEIQLELTKRSQSRN